MHYNEYIVLVVALTYVALVPMTFLVILYRGTKGVTPSFALKRDRVGYAGYFSFEFDEELKSLLKNCSVVKGRYFIILLSNDCKFCQ